MESLSASNVFKLPLPERILLVEKIWDSIADELESSELTDEEKNIINERLIKYNENPSNVIPWEQAYKNLLNKS